MSKKIVLLLLSMLNFLHAGFPENTLIKTDKSHVTIQLISPKNTVVGLDIKNNSLVNTEYVYTFTLAANHYYCISLPNETIICSENQRFYDPTSKAWIKAREITEQSHFLDCRNEIIPCIQIDKIEQDKPIIFYEILLNEPHTYFVSKSQVLTHNLVPIVIGLSWTFGEGIALTGAGVGLGTLGFGLWQKFGKNKKITFAQIEKECMSSSGGNAPDPDDKSKIENMEQFFNTNFGKKIKNKVEKTNKNQQGQTVYRVKEKIPEYGLKKGDQLYLDSLHKDHLEVFTKHNRFKVALNLDGTHNIIKTVNATGRTL